MVGLHSKRSSANRCTRHLTTIPVSFWLGAATAHFYSVVYVVTSLMVQVCDLPHSCPRAHPYPMRIRHPSVSGLTGDATALTELPRLDPNHPGSPARACRVKDGPWFARLDATPSYGVRSWRGRPALLPDSVPGAAPADPTRTHEKERAEEDEHDRAQRHRRLVLTGTRQRVDLGLEGDSL
jgi:hypothetical protein